MRTQRLPRRGLAAFGSISFLFAVVAAGCSGGGGSGSSSSASLTPNLTSPTPGFQCASGAGGIAYIPDGGASGGTGLRIIPFETTNNQFTADCASRMLTTSASLRAFTAGAAGSGIAVAIPASGPRGYMGFSGLTTGGSPAAYPMFTISDPSPFGLAPASGAVPVENTTATSLALIPRGTFAFAVGADTSVTAGLAGVNNLLSLQPTPSPAVSPLPSATPTSTPAPFATATAYNPPAVDPSKETYVSIGVNPSASPTIAPSIALAVPTPGTGRTSIALGPDGTSMLVRGDKDLMGLSIVPTAAGYYVIYPAAGTTVPIDTEAARGNGISTALGYAPQTISAGLYPKGLIAFSPVNGGRALIGGSTAGSGAPEKDVSLLTGVPTDLTVSAKYTAGSQITALAVHRNGDLAAVGTTNGLEIIGGVTGSSLKKVDQTITSPITYVPSGGAASKTLGKILSVGFSPDGGILIVLADNGDSTASVLAFRFNADSGQISSPLGGSSMPATLGAPIPAPQGDYMVIR